MKLKKILAGITALAVAVSAVLSTTSVSASSREDVAGFNKIIVNGYELTEYEDSLVQPLAVSPDDFDYYDLDDDTVAIGYYWGDETKITIPGKSPEGKTVTRIDDMAFQYKDQITTITLPKSVTSIGRMAFYECSSLTGITINGTLTSIEEAAFYNCSALKTIKIPNVTAIEDETFYGCTSLESITLPSSMTSLGYSAFYECAALKSIKIPNGVESIEDNTFYGCTALATVEIPDTVTSIGESAFYECAALKSVKIPDGVELIDRETFYGCTSLTDVKIPNSVESIESGAFGYCTSLNSITIPASVTWIDSWAFDGHPEGFTIYGYDFSEAERFAEDDDINFESVGSAIDFTVEKNLEEETITIKRYTGNEEDIVIPDELGGWPVTEIGEGAFSGLTFIKSVEIPYSVVSINNSAFSGCTSLASVDLGEGVQTIKENAFKGCGALTTLVIPDSVTEIESNAFDDCKSLKFVIMGDNLISFMDAFGSSSLVGVIIPEISIIDVDVEGYFPLPEENKPIIYGYRGYYGEVYARQQEIDFKAISEYGIEEDFVYVKDDDGTLSVVWYMGDDAEVTIPDILERAAVSEIGRNAFLGIGESLASVEIPDTVVKIREYAFNQCSSLVSVAIPDSVEEIGDGAFWGCMSLAFAYIPESVTSIGELAFHYSPAADNYAGLPKLTIYGKSGSEAERYADKENIPFVALGETLFDESGVQVTFQSDDNCGAVNMAVTREDKEGAISYDISLYNDDKAKVQPEQSVIVRIPVPAGWEGADIKVFHQDTDGTSHELPSHIESGYIVFTVDPDHFGKFTLTTTKPPVTDPTEPDPPTTVVPGDVNGDGKVDENDSVTFNRYFAKWEGITINTAASDINHDGTIDENGSVMLERYFAKWEGIVLY